MSRLQQLLEDLKIWKTSLIDKDWFLNTVDLDNMYPTMSIYIVEQALKEALSTCSDYNKDKINYSMQNGLKQQFYWISRNLIQTEVGNHNRRQ